MNASKIIFTLSLLASIFLPAMDRRDRDEVLCGSNTSYYHQLQKMACEANQVAQQAAVGCCIIAPFWITTGITSGVATYGVCSCIRADHEKDASIQYVAAVSASAIVTSAALITCWSMSHKCHGKKFKKP